MKFGIYSVRDLKTGFQTPVTEVNDAVAIRNFTNVIFGSDSILFTHPEDFSLFKLAEYDTETGRITPLDLPQEMIQAVAAKAARAKQ